MNPPGPAESATGEGESAPPGETAAGRRAWEFAARACYRELGVPFPGRVVWVPSPLVGAFAAPIAACLSVGHRNARVLDSVYRAVDDTAGETVGRAVRAAVQAASDGATSDPVHGAAATALHADIAATMRPAKAAAVRAAAVRDAAVGDAAVGDAAVGDAAVGDAAVGDAAVGDAARVTSDDEVSRSVPPRELPTRALAAVAEASEVSVWVAVDAAVGGPRQDTIRGEVRRLWRAYVDGQKSGAWPALVRCFEQDAARPPHEDPSWPAAAEQVAARFTPAGWWWWPFLDFVMLSPRPAEVHLEQVGEDNRAIHRPHRADGPAAGWDDGFGVYFWHGTHVTRAVIEDTLTTDEILRETNAEIRRCAIERRGWDRFIDEAGLAQIGSAVPDPGNPGQTLTLHDVPEGVYTTHVRVLLCTNGTVERDGIRRRFGLTVPADCTDPLQAAAWTYGLTPAQYAGAQRRS